VQCTTRLPFVSLNQSRLHVARNGRHRLRCCPPAQFCLRREAVRASSLWWQSALTFLLWIRVHCAVGTVAAVGACAACMWLLLLYRADEDGAAPLPRHHAAAAAARGAPLHLVTLSMCHSVYLLPNTLLLALLLLSVLVPSTDFPTTAGAAPGYAPDHRRGRCCRCCACCLAHHSPASCWPPAASCTAPASKPNTSTRCTSTCTSACAAPTAGCGAPSPPPVLPPRLLVLLVLLPLLLLALLLLPALAAAACSCCRCCSRSISVSARLMAASDSGCDSTLPWSTPGPSS
jgi:hypothetical protein